MNFTNFYQSVATWRSIYRELEHTVSYYISNSYSLSIIYGQANFMQNDYHYFEGSAPESIQLLILVNYLLIAGS